MKETTLTMPELAMIGGTRVALGAVVSRAGGPIWRVRPWRECWRLRCCWSARVMRS